MKVQELLTSIKNEEFNLESALEIKKYIPLELKKTIAQGVIFECTDDDDGAVKVDSVQKYMSYIKYILTTYTNLEYVDSHYDLLRSTEYSGGNLLDAIIKCFKSDAQECSDILNMMLDDYLRENSMEFIVIGVLNELVVSLENVTDVLCNKIESIDLKSLIPSDMSLKQIAGLLGKYNTQ